MKVKIAAVQMEVIGERPEKNLTSALRLADKAIVSGAEYIVFPETMTSDYSRRIKDFAEAIPGPTSDEFQKLAKKRFVNIVISVNEKNGNSVYNSVVLIEPRGIAGIYRKTHLWKDEDNLEGLEDSDMFTAGERLDVFDFGRIKAGVMICWDGQYPEVPRILSLKGADVIFYPNNRSGMNHGYISALAERNVIPIVAVNRVGIREIYPPEPDRTRKLLPVQIETVGGKTIYRCRGDTAVFDERGQTVAKAHEGENIIIAEIDIEKVRRMKAVSQYLLNRRPELYHAVVRETT